MCQEQDHRKNPRSQTMSIEMKASKRKKKSIKHCISPIFWSYRRSRFGVTSDLTVEVQATPRPLKASLELIPGPHQQRRWFSFAQFVVSDL